MWAIHLNRDYLTDSDPVFKPYMVVNRRFITSYGIITGSLPTYFSQHSTLTILALSSPLKLFSAATGGWCFDLLLRNARFSGGDVDIPENAELWRHNPSYEIKKPREIKFFKSLIYQNFFTLVWSFVGQRYLGRNQCGNRYRNNYVVVSGLI